MKEQDADGGPSWPPVPHFPKDAFVGTAQLYAEYRPAYPEAMLNDILGHLDCVGSGRLLDLGCGPGKIGLAVGESFGEVWGVDPEPEMIQEARRRTPANTHTQYRWIVGDAEQPAHERTPDLGPIAQTPEP